MDPMGYTISIHNYIYISTRYLLYTIYYTIVAMDTISTIYYIHTIYPYYYSAIYYIISTILSILYYTLSILLLLEYYSSYMLYPFELVLVFYSYNYELCLALRSPLRRRLGRCGADVLRGLRSEADAREVRGAPGIPMGFPWENGDFPWENCDFP